MHSSLSRDRNHHRVAFARIPAGETSLPRFFIVGVSRKPVTSSCEVAGGSSAACIAGSKICRQMPVVAAVPSGRKHLMGGANGSKTKFANCYGSTVDLRCSRRPLAGAAAGWSGRAAERLPWTD